MVAYLVKRTLVADPGTYMEGWTEPFPDLNELKRIYVSNPLVPNFKVISFMLPHKDDFKSKKLPYAGALMGYYYSSLVPIDNTKQVYEKSAYKAISKKWRASHSTLHDTTKQFINEARIDTSDDIGLSKLMKTVRELLVSPEMKVMIHKIVNQALYVGLNANTYQLQIKKVKDPEILVPPVCIYRTYV